MAVASRLAKEHEYTVIIGSHSLPAGFSASAVQLDLASHSSVNAAGFSIAD